MANRSAKRRPASTPGTTRASKKARIRSRGAIRRARTKTHRKHYMSNLRQDKHGFIRIKKGIKAAFRRTRSMKKQWKLDRKALMETGLAIRLRYLTLRQAKQTVNRAERVLIGERKLRMILKVEAAARAEATRSYGNHQHETALHQLRITYLDGDMSD